MVVKKWRSPLKVSDADRMKREVESELKWPFGKSKKSSSTCRISKGK